MESLLSWRRPARTRTARAKKNRLMVYLVSLAMVAAASLVATPAHAATVMIDDFSGTIRGTRSVDTTGPATFNQSNGLGIFTASGSGNTAGAATLTYTMPQSDLTDSGSNTQFFFEFTDIHRTNRPNVWDTAANISISVTGGGVTGVYNTAVTNTDGPFNVVFNLNCGTSGGACFTPLPNFTAVTKIEIRVAYPQNYDSSNGTLTAQLEQIRTTPAGGAVPAVPRITVDVPQGNPVYAPVGGTISFPATRTLGYGASLVNGLTANEVSVTGTAGGTVQSVTNGNAANPTIQVGGFTQSGTVQVHVAAGAIVDDWDQVSPAESSTPVTITLVALPAWTSAAPAPAIEGEPYSHTFMAAPAGSGTTYSLISGALPSGMSLSSAGVLSGTPQTRGAYSFTVRATNVAGQIDQAVSFEVDAPAVFTSGTTASFVVGQAGSFTVTTSGRPDATVSLVGQLPSGLNFTAGTGGTATISGVPTTPGVTDVTLNASNGVGSAATQTLSIVRNQVPVITVAPTATVTVGVPFELPITTSGHPTATLQTSGLPAGLALVDNGDGTGQIQGTATQYSSQPVHISITATNSEGVGSQSVTLTLRGPAEITSPDTATVTVGQAASITITTDGVPTPTIDITGLPTGLNWVDNQDGTATISGTPTTSGSVTATVTADNSIGDPAVQQLVILVQQGPGFTSGTVAEFTRGTAGDFTISTTGFPAPTIIHVDELPTGLNLGASESGQAILSGTPSVHGVFTVLLRASNGVGTAAEQTLTIIVNGAPIVPTPTFATATVGDTVEVVVNASGYPVPELSATGLPEGLTLTDNLDGTARIAGVIAATESGPHEVTIIGTNQVGTNSATATWIVNEPPSFTSGTEATFNYDVGGSFAITTQGYPAAAIDAGAGQLPLGLYVIDAGDGTAVITGTTTAFGTYQVTLYATNGVGPVVQQNITITVQGKPVIDTLAHRVVQVGQEGSFQIGAAGLPTATIEVAGLPAGLSYAESTPGYVTIVGVPASGTGGEYEIHVTATNSLGSDSSSFTLTVNEAPAITSGASVTWAQGDESSHTITTTGFPLPTVSTVGPLPTGITLVNEAPGIARLGGVPAVHGEFQIDIEVSNGIGSAATQTVAATITAPAALAAITDTTAEVGSSLEIPLVVTGHPRPVLSAAGLPDGLVLNQTTEAAVISGTPVNGTGGQHEVTVSATNDHGDADRSFTLTVNESPVITSANTATLTRGVAGQVVVTASGYPVPTVAVAGTLPTWLTASDPGTTPGRLELSGTPNADGLVTIEVSATNGIGVAATQTISITVLGEPDVTGTVTVAGTGTANDALVATSTVASSTPGATITGQWLRDGVAIPGATSDTYTPTNADAGSLIGYDITVTAPQYVPAVVSSDPIAITGVITLAEPVITGDQVVDEVLSAMVPSVDPADAAVEFVWLRGETEVGTGDTYAISAVDLGEELTVIATATAEHFHQKSTSQRTGPIAAAQFSTPASVAIEGTAQVGETLLAVVGDATPAAEAVRYAWFADGMAIADATDSTLDLVKAHQGKVIKVVVTTQRAGYVDAVSTAVTVAAVVTNEAPGLTLRTSAGELRRGQKATLHWTTVDATSVMASGTWAGLRAETGTEAVTPRHIGSNVYVLRASNHIGTTTAQIVINVRREAAQIAVIGPKKKRKPGKMITVRLRGMDAGEAFTVLIAGRKVAKGTANGRGNAKVRAVIPRKTKAGKQVAKRAKVSIEVRASLADRRGQQVLKIAKTRKVAPLRVQVRSAQIRASDRQRIVITGLKPRERVSVQVQGVRVSPRGARANRNGRYRLTFGVGIYWGTKVVRVTGGKHKGATVVTYEVTPRWG